MIALEISNRDGAQSQMQNTNLDKYMATQEMQWRWILKETQSYFKTHIVCVCVYLLGGGVGVVRRLWRAIDNGHRDVNRFFYIHNDLKAICHDDFDFHFDVF